MLVAALLLVLGALVNGIGIKNAAAKAEARPKPATAGAVTGAATAVERVAKESF